MTRQALTALLTFGLVLTMGCAAVRGRRAEPELTGFLGDYSRLQPIGELEGRLAYVRKDADWQRYDAIELDSVTLWASDENVKLNRDEQQMLTDLLFDALSDELEARFVLAKQSGPSVLRVRAALTQAKGAKVPMRVLSTLVPQALLIGTGVGLSLDTARTVGTATIELEVLDSVTDRRLVALVDQRAGTKSPLALRRTFKTWADVEAACDFWASRVAEALEHQGVRPKSVSAP